MCCFQNFNFRKKTLLSWRETLCKGYILYIFKRLNFISASSHTAYHKCSSTIESNHFWSRISTSFFIYTYILSVQTLIGWSMGRYVQTWVFFVRLQTTWHVINWSALIGWNIPHHLGQKNKQGKLAGKGDNGFIFKKLN